MAAALAFARGEPDRRVTAPVALFTSLPILWNENADLGSILADPAPPHWARAELARLGPIVPLDTLAQPDGQGPLVGLGRLVMAQPRPLSPAENVALDAWVRAGGRLLLFADPALTAESRFAIGDPRRPITGALLSPILNRWGLELRFDDTAAFGERMAQGDGVRVPVNLPGRWRVRSGAGCTLSVEELVADCKVGKGRVLAVADAAVLDHDGDTDTRQAALRSLFQRLFDGG